MCSDIVKETIRKYEELEHWRRYMGPSFLDCSWLRWSLLEIVTILSLTQDPSMFARKTNTRNTPYALLGNQQKLKLMMRWFDTVRSRRKRRKHSGRWWRRLHAGSGIESSRISLMLRPEGMIGPAFPFRVPACSLLAQRPTRL
jgi:hypothetical protein